MGFWQQAKTGSFNLNTRFNAAPEGPLPSEGSDAGSIPAESTKCPDLARMADEGESRERFLPRAD
jgi:hypothetical protein